MYTNLADREFVFSQQKATYLQLYQLQRTNSA